MKNLALLLFIFLMVSSCGTSKKSSKKVIIERNSVEVTESKRSPKETKNISKKELKKRAAESTITSEKKANKIVDYAKSFEGTRYKFGGTDKKGMDCSGLVYISFQKADITLPRISRDMAKKGTSIKLNNTEEGDLIFFQTNRKRRVINHVGLVVENKRGKIFFIHSTTSKGVIVSSLEEDYWKNAFVEVRRII